MVDQQTQQRPSIIAGIPASATIGAYPTPAQSYKPPSGAPPVFSFSSPYVAVSTPAPTPSPTPQQVAQVSTTFTSSSGGTYTYKEDVKPGQTAAETAQSLQQAQERLVSQGQIKDTGQKIEGFQVKAVGFDTSGKPTYTYTTEVPASSTAPIQTFVEQAKTFNPQLAEAKTVAFGVGTVSSIPSAAQPSGVFEQQVTSGPQGKTLPIAAEVSTRPQPITGETYLVSPQGYAITGLSVSPAAQFKPTRLQMLQAQQEEVRGILSTPFEKGYGTFERIGALERGLTLAPQIGIETVFPTTAREAPAVTFAKELTGYTISGISKGVIVGPILEPLVFQLPTVAQIGLGIGTIATQIPEVIKEPARIGEVAGFLVGAKIGIEAFKPKEFVEIPVEERIFAREGEKTFLQVKAGGIPTSRGVTSVFKGTLTVQPERIEGITPEFPSIEVGTRGTLSGIVTTKTPRLFGLITETTTEQVKGFTSLGQPIELPRQDIEIKGTREFISVPIKQMNIPLPKLLGKTLEVPLSEQSEMFREFSISQPSIAVGVRIPSASEGQSFAGFGATPKSRFSVLGTIYEGLEKQTPMIEKPPESLVDIYYVGGGELRGEGTVAIVQEAQRIQKATLSTLGSTISKASTVSTKPFTIGIAPTEEVSRTEFRTTGIGITEPKELPITTEARGTTGTIRISEILVTSQEERGGTKERLPFIQTVRPTSEAIARSDFISPMITPEVTTRESQLPRLNLPVVERVTQKTIVTSREDILEIPQFSISQLTVSPPSLFPDITKTKERPPVIPPFEEPISPRRQRKTKRRIRAVSVRRYEPSVAAIVGQITFKGKPSRIQTGIGIRPILINEPTKKLSRRGRSKSFGERAGLI